MVTTTEQIAKLNQHYILCGAGRTGLHIAERFLETKMPFVVIEHNRDAIAKMKHTLAGHDQPLLAIHADATEDETLELVGIEQATGLITALSDDKDNLFVILTARSLNPSLQIVTRVNEPVNAEKLRKAGANKVISTNAIGGLRMASEMIRPAVVNFIDEMVRATEKRKTLRFTELSLNQIKVPELKAMIDTARTTHDFHLHINDIGRHTGLLVVAIKSTHEEPHFHQAANSHHPPRRKRYRFTHQADERIDIDDVLIVIGTQDTLEAVLGQQ